MTEDLAMDVAGMAAALVKGRGCWVDQAFADVWRSLLAEGGLAIPAVIWNRWSAGLRGELRRRWMS